MSDRATADQSPAARQLESGGWEDEHGFVGPYRPGVGPRNDPIGDFPTGPAVSERLPPIVAPAHTGELIDVLAATAGRPAVVQFSRSAVW